MNGLQNASVWDMAREKHLDKRSAALVCLGRQDGLFGRGATLWSRGAIRETGQNAMQLSSWTAKVWAPNWVLPTTSHVDSTGRAPVCCSGCCLSFRKQSQSHLTEVHVHAGEISQCLDNLQDVLGTLGFLAVSRRRRT